MILGNDVFIDDTCRFMRPQLVSIGSHAAIDFCFYCTTKLTVGDYVHISSHVSVIGGGEAELSMDNFSFISAGSRIICRSDNMKGDGMVGPTIPKKYQDSRTGNKVTIEKFAGVGTNSVVLPDITMAEGSILGANSLLTKSTEPWTVYAGSPAKPISIRSKENILKMYEEMNQA
jgi:acetyltransferase-like isoleucine patch superfamily enzyme